METILVICAHNDDQLFGAGGTLAKYAEEGKKVKTIILSFGEGSHPHYKPDIITKMRVRESLISDKIIKGAGITYLGVKEATYKKEIVEKEIKKKLIWIIKKEKPSKIFTHSIDDLHPLHRAVYKLIQELIKEKIITCEVYTFDIWTFVNFRQRNNPKLIVDISKTFKKKRRAINAHKSQINFPGIILLRLKVLIINIINGWQNECMYAETFTKLQ